MGKLESASTRLDKTRRDGGIVNKAPKRRNKQEMICVRVSSKTKVDFTDKVAELQNIAEDDIDSSGILRVLIRLFLSDPMTQKKVRKALS